MKKLLVVLLIVAVAFISCESDVSTNDNSAELKSVIDAHELSNEYQKAYDDIIESMSSPMMQQINALLDEDGRSCMSRYYNSILWLIKVEDYLASHNTSDVIKIWEEAKEQYIKYSQEFSECVDFN